MSTAAVKPPTTRAELLAALNEAARRQSTATVLFHAAVAERLGLSATDHKYADLIARQGPMTAGELADRAGLTTGAITGRSEEHTSELQSRLHLVCRLL